MRIAIFDPDPAAAKKLKNALYAYAESRRLDILAESFFSAEALMQSGKKYRLFFIACDPGSSDGLEAAKTIKRLFAHSSVILLGRSPDLLLRALKVKPLQILLKPLQTAPLFETLDDYFSAAAAYRPLWLKNGIDTVCCTVGEIRYLEADNKHCFVSLEHKKVPCHRTMAHLSHALPANCFLKISRSYIVNLSYIESYNKKTVRLTNGETLPVTKRYYNSFQSGFSAFCDPIKI